MESIEQICKERDNAVSALKIIRDQMPHFEHALINPENGRDIWLHDLILFALPERDK